MFSNNCIEICLTSPKLEYGKIMWSTFKDLAAAILAWTPPNKNKRKWITYFTNFSLQGEFSSHSNGRINRLMKIKTKESKSLSNSSTRPIFLRTTLNEMHSDILVFNILDLLLTQITISIDLANHQTFLQCLFRVSCDQQQSFLFIQFIITTLYQ